MKKKREKYKLRYHIFYGQLDLSWKIRIRRLFQKPARKKYIGIDKEFYKRGLRLLPEDKRLVYCGPVAEIF